jgi:hypothetical protein
VTRRALLRAAVVGVAAVASVPLLSGCSARLSQLAAVAADGGGNLSVELRLDPEAQRAINLPAQLSAGTFTQFLKTGGEVWSAPGDPTSTFRQTREADGTVVLTSVHRLRAGTGDLTDLRSALDTSRSLQPILSTTGRFWAAPRPGEADTTTTNGTRTTSTTQVTGAGEPQNGITGLPPSVTLQTLLASDFTPAHIDRSDRKMAPTFTVASRGGVGDVLDPICDAGSNRYVKTRADKALGAGLEFRYTWAMPTGILELSEGAMVTPDNQNATWAMPYGQCTLMELSSAGADDGRFVNGLILGGVLLFLLIVFALRSLARRRGTPDSGT